jgi:2',3'-cyclic-nucleotide 2'-phosphodiesterase (5'-nucleotidase family)
MRAGTGADVALLNSGTLRLDEVIPPGPISNHQIEAIFPFADQTRVIIFPLTASQLRRLLEHSVSDGVIGTGGFLQVSGLSFTFDPSRASGNRLIGPIRRRSGGALEPGDSVSVALGAYSACDGGDGYRVPEAAGACTRRTMAPRAVDLLVQYIADSLGGRIEPPRDARVVQAENTNPG